MKSPCATCNSKLDRKLCSIECKSVKQYSAITGGFMPENSYIPPPDEIVLQKILSKAKSLANQPRPRTTTSERRAICEMWMSGATLNEIAIEFRRSKFTVQQIVKRAGLRIKDLKKKE